MVSMTVDVPHFCVWIAGERQRTHYNFTLTGHASHLLHTGLPAAKEGVVQALRTKCGRHRWLVLLLSLVTELELTQRRSGVSWVTL